MTDYAIGIDLGGTFIKYILASNKGEVLINEKIPSDATISKDKVIQNIILACNTVIKYANNNKIKISGIGIGTPGIVDNGIVLGGAENIKNWENINLSHIISNKTKLPVYVDNDANLMGFGEFKFGAGKGKSDIIFLTIGTGIGGAIVINNKIYGGRNNRGAELGHIPLFADGDKCNCGSIGCLEEYASVTGLIKRYKKRLTKNNISIPPSIDGKYIVNLYHQNNKIAVDTINENCYYLGRGIAAFINIFSPQSIIIGGGISEAGDFYINKIKEYAYKYAMDECNQNTEIISAKLGNKAGAIGAAALCF